MTSSLSPRKQSSPRKRRLLVVTHYFPSHGGGVEGIAQDIAHRLLELAPDLEIHWCASDCDSLPPTHKGLFYHPLRAWNGLEKRTGLPYPLPGLRAVWQLWRETARCDIVHLHDFSYASNVLTALFCRMQNKPYLVTQHIGMVPYKNPLFRFVLSLLNGTLGRWSLRHAARVVFYSRLVEKYFGRSVPRTRRAFVLNGVDAKKFFRATSQQRTALRQEYNVLPTELAVGFVGRFVEKKGIPLLLELARQFPQVRWLLAGRGPLDPGDDRDANISIWRDKSGAQIGDLMRSMDVLVLPSRGEGFPLVVQEALACGTAVLAERELARAQPESTQWVELLPLGHSDDLERWTVKLQAMLDEISNDAAHAEQQRLERAQWANQKWNWTQCAREYLRLFDEILGEGTS